MVAVIERPITKTEVHPKWEFLPVIFANGIDDDMPGFVAALANEKVQYKDKAYKPDEDLNITDAHIRWRVSDLKVYEGDALVLHLGQTGCPSGPEIVINLSNVGGERQINIENCTISCL